MTISSVGWQRHALLTPQQMGEADRLTIAGGIPGVELMEKAGRGVADAVSRRGSARPGRRPCGPGEKGGAGLVAAPPPAQRRWPGRGGPLASRPAWRGDAGAARRG